MRAIVLAVLLLVAVGAADDAAAQSDWHLAIGPTAGSVIVDGKLAEYRWDTRPALQSGIAAALYRGRFAAGLSLWRAQTTQSSGIPGESQTPRVNLTGFDLTGQVRVIERLGVELWGTAHAGMLHLGYDPDRLTFDTGGTAVTVDYRPISEWDFGVGGQLRTEITRHVSLSFQAERSTFSMDTAHRAGSDIVNSRERFYGWSMRLHIAWLVRLA